MAWLKATRPLAHANIAPPILLGVAFAYAAGFALDPWLVGLAFAFGVLDHLVIVFANDYADRDADALHEAPTLFSGGSRVIQEGLLRPAQLRRAAGIAAAALLVLCVAAAFALERPFLPAFGVAALVLLHAYSFPPLRLSYRGFGELLQGLGVGLVLPLVGWYCVAGRLDGAPTEAFAPLVMLGFVSNIVTALPDVHADRAAEKRSWPVQRGEAAARRDALVLLGLGLLIASQVGPELSPIWLGVAFAPAALSAILALLRIKRADAANRDDCLRFVTFGAGAITLLHLGWAGALLLAER